MPNDSKPYTDSENADIEAYLDMLVELKQDLIDANIRNRLAELQSNLNILTSRLVNITQYNDAVVEKVRALIGRDTATPNNCASSKQVKP